MRQQYRFKIKRRIDFLTKHEQRYDNFKGNLENAITQSANVPEANEIYQELKKSKSERFSLVNYEEANNELRKAYLNFKFE